MLGRVPIGSHFFLKRYIEEGIGVSNVYVNYFLIVLNKSFRGEETMKLLLIYSNIFDKHPELFVANLLSKFNFYSIFSILLNLIYCWYEKLSRGPPSLSLNPLQCLILGK